MDLSNTQSAKSFAFGPFTLVPDRQLLVEDEEPIHLGGRALDILAALVERPGELISKRDLITRAWPHTFVDEGNLKVNIAALRKALGESAGAGQYIATVTGRGYRFVAPVRLAGSGACPMLLRRQTDEASKHAISGSNTVGRAKAIADVLHELEGCRLVVIVGAGGIGKTRVAQAVAERCDQVATDGAWFIDLTAVKDPAKAPDAIAKALGLSDPSPDSLAALCAFLRERQGLLVLDNCEHLIEAVAQTAERIVACAAGVRILATSREPLGLGGEHVHRLEPLETPPPSAHLTAAEAMRYPAVELFVERARRRCRAFVLDEVNAPIIGEICRRLDGLALAIELAATRIDAFGPRELLGLIDQRFQLLRGHRAGPERHQTLATAIDWSFELLTEAEEAILRRLAIFPGVFSLEAACVVVDDCGEPEQSIEHLANLIAKSLVTAEHCGAGTRYRLMNTMRAYALEKLAASGELEAVRRRHAEHASGPI